MSARVRTGLIAVDDGLYTHRWASRVLDSPKIEPVFATRLSPLKARRFNPGAGRSAGALSRVRYYGPAASLKFACGAALSAARDAAFRAGLGFSPGSVRGAALRLGVPLLPAPDDDVEDGGYVREVRRREPDILVCAFSQRAARLLDAPRLGCLNVHFSMLPLNRGREPLFHSMLSGKGAGVSVHWMTPGLDEGPVVLQEPLDAGGFRTLHALILAASAVAARLVPKAVPLAAAGPRSAARPPSPLPPMNGWPTPEQVAAFRRKGLRFI